jgi:hypothetical protein
MRDPIPEPTHPRQSQSAAGSAAVLAGRWFEVQLPVRLAPALQPGLSELGSAARLLTCRCAAFGRYICYIHRPRQLQTGSCGSVGWQLNVQCLLGSVAVSSQQVGPLHGTVRMRIGVSNKSKGVDPHKTDRWASISLCMEWCSTLLQRHVAVEACQKAT